eukprot:5688252-Amphidinium_carterae.2
MVPATTASELFVEFLETHGATPSCLEHSQYGDAAEQGSLSELLSRHDWQAFFPMAATAHTRGPTRNGCPLIKVSKKGPGCPFWLAKLADTWVDMVLCCHI